MIILGITGTLGAGKGTVVEYLKTKGFSHFSARAFITEEIERRGMPVNRDSMTVVANDLRTKHSPSYIAEQLYSRAAATGQNSIIESIRATGEVDALRKLSAGSGSHAFFIAVDADIATRYERIHNRANETDSVSFEKFAEQERTEITSTDPTKQNIAGVMALADFTVTNNGTLEELHEQVDEILKKLN